MTMLSGLYLRLLSMGVGYPNHLQVRKRSRVWLDERVDDM